MHDVNLPAWEFEQMQTKSMKKMKGGGLMKMMKKLGGMGHGMPKLPGM